MPKSIVVLVVARSAAAQARLVKQLSRGVGAVKVQVANSVDQALALASIGHRGASAQEIQVAEAKATAEAENFMQALLSRVCRNKGYRLAGEVSSVEVAGGLPHSRLFVRNSTVAKAWQLVRSQDNMIWAGRRVAEHVQAGRLTGLSAFRLSTERGYMLDPLCIVRFLAKRAGQDVRMVVDRWCKTQRCNRGCTL